MNSGKSRRIRDTYCEATRIFVDEFAGRGEMKTTRSRLWATLCGVTLGVLVAPGTVRAEEVNPSLDVGRFVPAEAGSMWFSADSLDFRSSRYLTVRALGSYTHKPFVVYTADGETGSIIERQGVGQLSLAAAFGERVRVGASLPASFYSVGSPFTVGGVQYGAPGQLALGDARAAVDVRLYGHYGDPFTLALGARGAVPLRVGDAYLSDDRYTMGGSALFAGQVGYFTYAGSLGYSIKEFDVPDARSTATLALGAVLLDGALFVGPEAVYTTPANASVFSIDDSSLEVFMGSHYDVMPSLRLGLGGSMGFLYAVGTPMARGLLTAEWTWNRALPPPPPPAPIVVAEVLPPPPPVVIAPEPPPVVDSDGDGVPDEKDTCPGVAGVTLPNGASPGCPVKVVIDEKMVIDEVQFEKNVEKVKQSSDAAMEQILSTLKGLPKNARFKVEGHSDNSKGKKKSVELSKKRADAVVDWFKSKGFEAGKFDTVGVGQEKPVESNKTKKGRAKNRRVEVYITIEDTQPTAPEGTEKK